MQRVAVTTQGANADAMIAKNALEISEGRSVFEHGELAMRIADIVSRGKFDGANLERREFLENYG
jgi:hypothetical protein